MTKSADRELADAYFAAIRANTVRRVCMCCRAPFETDQAYRLCFECRSEGAWLTQITPRQDDDPRRQLSSHG